MANQQNESQIGVRVPQRLRELIKEYLALDTHKNESEFVRDAIREKIHRDAPGLFEQVFKEHEAGQ